MLVGAQDPPHKQPQHGGGWFRAAPGAEQEKLRPQPAPSKTPPQGGPVQPPPLPVLQCPSHQLGLGRLSANTLSMQVTSKAKLEAVPAGAVSLGVPCPVPSPAEVRPVVGNPEEAAPSPLPPCCRWPKEQGKKK